MLEGEVLEAHRPGLDEERDAVPSRDGQSAPSVAVAHAVHDRERRVAADLLDDPAPDERAGGLAGSPRRRSRSRRGRRGAGCGPWTAGAGRSRSRSRSPSSAIQTGETWGAPSGPVVRRGPCSALEQRRHGATTVARPRSAVPAAPALAGSPCPARVPISRCSTRRCSSGAWMASSGRPKPVRIVGMPFAASTATTGSVPPRRTGAGRQPVAASIAVRGRDEDRMAGVEDRRQGAGRGPRSSTSAPSGAASRSSSSSTAPRASASCPPASRSDSVAAASDGMLVLTAEGSPHGDPVDVERRRREGPHVEAVGGARVGGPQPGGGEGLGPRREVGPGRDLGRAGGRDAGVERQRAGGRPAASTAARISSEGVGRRSGPPRRRGPEWASPAAVRTRTRR